MFLCHEDVEWNMPVEVETLYTQSNCSQPQANNANRQ